MEHIVKEIQPEDSIWIQDRAAEGRRICEQYGVSQETHLSPALMDLVFHSWWNDRGSKRVTEQDIVNCLGCLFGEILRLRFKADWSIITDQYGTDLALQVDTNGNTFEFTPCAFVAKRVVLDEEESGFFAGMENLLLRELGRSKP